MAWVYISPRGRYCPVGPHDSRLRQPTTPHASSNANSSVRGIARDTSPRRRSCLPTSRTAGKALTQHVEIFPCSGVLWYMRPLDTHLRDSRIALLHQTTLLDCFRHQRLRVQVNDLGKIRIDWRIVSCERL